MALHNDPQITSPDDLSSKAVKRFIREQESHFAATAGAWHSWLFYVVVLLFSAGLVFHASLYHPWKQVDLLRPAFSTTTADGAIARKILVCLIASMILVGYVVFYTVERTLLRVNEWRDIQAKNIVLLLVGTLVWACSAYLSFRSLPVYDDAVSDALSIVATPILLVCVAVLERFFQAVARILQPHGHPRFGVLSTGALRVMWRSYWRDVFRKKPVPEKRDPS